MSKEDGNNRKTNHPSIKYHCFLGPGFPGLSFRQKKISIFPRKEFSPKGRPVRKFHTPFRHQLQIRLIIIIIEKCLLSPVPALGNMMRKARSYNSCNSQHTANKPDALSIVNN